MRLVHSFCSQGPLAHRFFLRPPPPARPARAVRRARTAAAAMSEAKRPVMARAAKVLKETFGHDDFRAGQREVIRLLLAPPDGAPARAVAVFPTGAGKSLTYQLPALLYESGVTLVVSPLLALMRDQTRALVSNGVPAASMDSTLDAQESRDVYDDVSTGKVKLLFVAPERFKNERFIRLLKRVSVALFVVDEAHCISEWGHSFRPDYLRLARFADELKFERRLCLTATATPKVAKDIAQSMSVPYPSGVVRTPAVRPNLDTRITLVESEYSGERRNLTDAVLRRVDVLAERIKSRPPGATIVYVTLQATAVVVAEQLRKHGLINCKAYHAGIPQDERKATQDWFMDASDGESAIVCATIAFGMGIDKANIRYVYHFNLPKSLESYTQEVGRAGRDGLPSVCETLACIDDIPTLEGFALGATPSRSSIAHFVHGLLDGKRSGDVVDLSVYDTAQDLDIRESTINQMLAQLDLNGGYVRETTPFYKELKCRIVSRPVFEAILSAPDSRAARILSRASGSGVVRTVDTRQVAAELGIEKGSISRELDDLVRANRLQKVSPYKLHAQFQVTAVPAALDEVVDVLHTAAKRMEEREVVRIREVVDYLSASSCQTKLLSERFGDDVAMLADCGHCAVCHAGGRQAVTIEDEHVKRLGKELDVRRWALVQAQDALPADNPLLMARFAAGISSPAIAKKYRRLPGFGTLSDHSWQTLISAAEAECARR